MKRQLMLMGVSMLVLGMLGCDAVSSYPKKIQELPEPWKVLEPGTPRVRFPTPRVITEGGGPVIGSGDLVQLHIRSKSQIPGRLWNDWGNWWIWIGFMASEETNFFSIEPRTASALVGVHEGSTIEFVDGDDGSGKSPEYAGLLKPNIFGDADYYAWKKNVRGDVSIYVSSYSTPSTVEIKRVCKGQTKYRTVRLFDDSPVQVCAGLNCRITNEAREAWVDEARIDAACQDGKKVSFQYGPIDSRNGKTGRSPKRGYFDEWLRDAWDKVPAGVQVEGNHAPVVEATRVKTKVGIALHIDFRKFAKDADGDPLTARIIRVPEKGNLSQNPDGSMTYTPKEKFFGFDHATFGISDGMTETVGMIEIEVNQPAW